VKGSRFSHAYEKVEGSAAGLEKFFPASIYEREAGRFSFNCRRIRVNLQRLEEFFVLFPRHRYAFEFRNESGTVRTVLRLLRKHNSLLPFDLAGYQSPDRVTADFTYIRCTAGGKYQGCLDVSARKWRGGLGMGPGSEAIYVYFDNDDSDMRREMLSLRESLAV